ncbi:unnamed protein product [Notodromas monacha]|uniref:Probable oligoribonuclease n=1 Tax=Notodromas monacha TaxID=399045 RepID=A0A7R9GD48_9CRUS|nr:unnamed protein product [Notodromas monacha]CAG0918323.1 unnamed protein product [Notodromas monacha]
MYWGSVKTFTQVYPKLSFLKRLTQSGPRKDHLSGVPAAIMSTSAKTSRTGGKFGKRIIWIDLELTGLEQDAKILEIACLVTDPDLEVLDEGVECIVHQPDDVLNSMNAWCVEHHGKSGLTEACRKSTMSLEQAEQKVLKFVEALTPFGKCPIAGSSVHTDREYIRRLMPKFNEHCSYRIIDVSSIKEICRRWYPGIFSRCPTKKLSHRSLDDILESIEELKYYRQNIFVNEVERNARKEQEQTMNSESGGDALK